MYLLETGERVQDKGRKGKEDGLWVWSEFVIALGFFVVVVSVFVC